MKVEVGFGLPSVPRGTYHCSPIPDGYAVVGVDEVLKGFEHLELDFPSGEGENELGEARKTTILWKKGKHRVSTLGAKSTYSSE